MEQDVEPLLAGNGILYVPVVVGELTGWYAISHHKVIGSRGEIYTPTGFECAGGKEINRKWRLSIR